jgi:hypothetical protein
MITFLRAQIPGRADLATTMKTAIKDEIRPITMKGKVASKDSNDSNQIE